MLSTTDCIYSDSFQDLKVTDISEFVAIKVDPIMFELQNYFNDNIESIIVQEDTLVLPKKNAPSVLLDTHLKSQADDFLLIYLSDTLDMNYCLDKITVKYEDDYEYGIFDEYNLDADTVKSLTEYENVEECLSSNNECSYIESYNYGVYLEISLKKIKLLNR